MLTDVESDEFGIAHGTKHGDLWSSLLFNSVLQSAMEKDIETWKDKGEGIKLSDEKGGCISNLLFADDVLMMETSAKQIRKMIVDFKQRYRLEIHPDRTKILTNQKTYRTREVEIDGMHVEILLHQGKAKYLGQMITFVDQETAEVQHRIRCAWSAFARHRQELTSQS